ncbi:MAG: hypothetical protein LBR47_03030 [Spirochaetaceae bacterium]|nr:hypothetical protein [Spirochaetaceae bacterium]
MEKNRLEYTIFLVYEILRLVFIIYIGMQSALTDMPLSWYAGMALLVIPALLLVFLLRSEKEFAVFRPLLGIIKIAGIPAIGIYWIVSFPLAVQTKSLDNGYSLKILVFVLLILILDFIVGINCFRGYEQLKETDKREKISEGE